MITVAPADPRDPQAKRLLRASHAYLNSLGHPPASQHYLDIDALCGPSIQFFLAHRDQTAIGCGALAAMPTYGEVKSMFTEPSARHMGAASKLLDGLTAAARRAGFTHLRLETGHDMTSAIGFYTRHGFRPRGPFANYSDDPLSAFLEKNLG